MMSGTQQGKGSPPKSMSSLRALIFIPYLTPSMGPDAQAVSFWGRIRLSGNTAGAGLWLEQGIAEIHSISSALLGSLAGTMDLDMGKMLKGGG